MSKTLVVVESPAKAKTIEKYLGPDYSVRASYGHIRDLPTNDLAVDVDHGFDVTYVVPEDSKKHVSELKKMMNASDDLILATDYDREGEAIAFHVAALLGREPATAKRVTFTEITKDAILAAFSDPREIDLRLVDAQEARRVLDRLVGYKLSPILWKKVRPGLSAGRVQSVAVRLIVEREREIRAFVPVEYWSVDVRLTPEDKEQPFLARLVSIPSGKLATAPDKKGVLLAQEADAASHVELLGRAAYRVSDITQREVKRNPSAPFTTSTLQQEAARKLGFTARRTMSVAQRLYEGISLPGEGSVGLITYMRTDSVNIAESALAEIAQVVREKYGEQYALGEPRRYKKKQRGAQEAHEAVRPTSARRDPSSVASSLESDQLKLYTLIWQRTIASQMAEARFNQMGVDIEATADGATYALRSTGQTVIFDGFRRVYFEGRDDAPDEDAESMLPQLVVEQLLRKLDVLPEQHFTQPPPRFTEASLVKTLEENGIGRPSTYASIISRIQTAGYVRLQEKRFFSEDVAEVVVDKLVEHFPDIFEVGFTARMEDELDDIADGNAGKTQVLQDFWDPFNEDLGRAAEKFERYVVDLDEDCPKCITEGRTPPGHLQQRLGKFGFFIGCTRFDDEDGACKYIRNLNGEERPEPELLDEICPDCGKQLQKRFGRFGEFTGCSGYPDCRYIKKDPLKSTEVQCPVCKEGELVERKNRFGQAFYSCSRYPDCELAVSNPPLKDRPCPECTGMVLARPKSLKCWNCGCEMELDGTVKRSGDAEAEAEIRAAKAVAKAARAAAKKAKAKPAAKKKPATKKKPAAKKKPVAKKEPAAKKEPVAESEPAG